MERLTYSAKALLLGLAVAQALATFQVYLSNLDLCLNLVVMKAGGYLVVPNDKIISHLREAGPAFFGGLFFTLSIGAGLSLLALAGAWVWERLFFRNKFLLVPLGLLWVGLLVAVNHEGPSPLATSYVLIIPPVVFAAACRWMSAPRDRPIWPKRLVQIVPLAVLAAVGAYQVNGQLFSDVRDYLLLSNPLGTKLNDFYYEYTLYPAEVFKALDQKLLKTANVEALQEKNLARTVGQALLEYDYLPVREELVVDLKVSQEGKDLLFMHQGERVLRVPASNFLSAPGKALLEFSARTDRSDWLRRLTFLSLLVGLPLTLYLLLFAFFRLALSFVMDIGTASMISTGICFLVGMSLLLYFASLRPKEMDPKELAGALQSERWQVRVAALQGIERQGLDIGAFPAYKKLLTSREIPERYWMARALGLSRQPGTYPDLMRFLDDPHPNVACMAFYALGKRGDRGVTEEIKKRVETSPHWYVQWYGYKALRTLGWKQEAST